MAKVVLRESIHVMADVIEYIAYHIIPNAITKHINDGNLLWKITISWLEDNTPNDVFLDMSNTEAAYLLGELRKARNTVTHTRAINYELYAQIYNGYWVLLSTKIEYLNEDNYSMLLSEYMKFMDHSVSMGYSFPELLTRTEKEFDNKEYVDLPPGMKVTNTKTLKEWEVTHRRIMKYRRLFVHTGDYRGRECSFMIWEDTSAICIFDPEGQISIPSNVIVSLIAL